jgi:uncharacterized membrane-anchored protein YitT (DUF2179 family)
MISSLSTPPAVSPPRRADRRPARQYDRGISSYLLIVLGSVLTGLCFNLFLRATDIASGGIIGTSLVLKEAAGFEPAYSQWMLNAVLLLACASTLGKRFVVKSVAASLIIPFAVLATRGLPAPTNNPLLATICGSAGIGVGLGLVFRAGASVGGFGAVALALQRRLGISVDHTLIALDSLVVLSAAFLFTPEQALCGLIGVWITGRVARAVMTGLNRSRVAMIVSARALEIREAVLEQIPLGLTSLRGEGGYTGDPREVLMIVMNPAESVRLKELVRAIDPQAFLILSDATEVLGHGFAPLR